MNRSRSFVQSVLEETKLQMEESKSSEDVVSLAETVSVGSSDGDVDLVCDACPCCADRCSNDHCVQCNEKIDRMGAANCCCSWHEEKNHNNKFKAKKNKSLPSFTLCQVRRHNHVGSAWLVAGDTIYDATDYVHQHPGGVTSILRRAGGAKDCTQDLLFHSKKSRALWDQCIVGKLRPCPNDPCKSANRPDASADEKQWWMFWR